MSRVSPRVAGLALLMAVIAAAALLTRLDLRLASSQAVSVVVKETQADVPLDDPQASVWDTAEPVEIPLSAQNVAVPQGGGSIRAVTARALHDGDRIFFRLDWGDSSQDTSAFAPQQFRDAAAIQFPAGGTETLPSFCMGQAGGQVNIWHWKGDWQADIDRGFVNVPEAYPNAAADYYPFQDEDTFYTGRAAGNLLSQADRESPVENLVAAGFGTLSTATDQTVAGNGVWENGRWYVLFARNMVSKNATYTPFRPGQTTNVAFAVWDGSAGERDGLKSVSQFADLKIEGVARKGGGGSAVWVYVMGGAIIVLLAVVYWRFRRRGA